MKKDTSLQQENFDRLLDWLSPKREEAGQKYEQLRAGLVRFFRFRGCADPLVLADETINRVASKIFAAGSAANTPSAAVFYGFAAKIHLEYLSAMKRRREVSLDAVSIDSEKTLPLHLTEEANVISDCLESCLSKLPRADSQLILQYYSKEKAEKVELRKKLAQNLGLKIGTLHTRAHRLRDALKECVDKCKRESGL